MNRILFIIITFILISCNTTKNLAKEDVNSVLENKKAFVVFSNLVQYHKMPKSFINYLDWAKSTTIWSKDNIENAFDDNHYYRCNHEEFYFEGYIINPGTYRLEEVINSSRTANASTTRTFFIKNKKISFTVKGGEFLYLGELRIKVDHNNRVKLGLKDRFNEFNMSAPLDFPELYNRLQKKLFFSATE